MTKCAVLRAGLAEQQHSRQHSGALPAVPTRYFYPPAGWCPAAAAMHEVKALWTGCGMGGTPLASLASSNQHKIPDGGAAMLACRRL